MSLSQIDIEKFKRKLEFLRDRINHQVRGTSDAFAEGGRVSSEDDVDEFSQKMTIDVSGKELATLRQIARALEKIEENSYGICDLTGEEISLARLEAVPYAVMTVKAQDKLEKGLL